MTSDDTRKPIFSRALEAGHEPLDLPVGMTGDLFGRALAPASPLVTLAKEPANKMSVTFGRIGIGSLESAALQSSMANRLRAQLPLAGSMIFPMIWKQKHTPSLRQYCQLALRKRGIDAIDCGLWPTPLVPNGGRQPKNGAMSLTGKTPEGKKRQVDLNFMVKAVLWPTPRASEAGPDFAKEARSKTGMALPAVAALAAASLWATPSARDYKDTQGMAKIAGGGV